MSKAQPCSPNHREPEDEEDNRHPKIGLNEDERSRNCEMNQGTGNGFEFVEFMIILRQIRAERNDNQDFGDFSGLNADAEVDPTACAAVTLNPEDQHQS